MDVMYAHDDSEDVEDSFSIRLTDGKHQVDRRLRVEVLPVNDQVPRIIRFVPQLSP